MQESLRPGTVPMVDYLRKAAGWAENNYTVIAIDFASRNCVSRGNSANSQLSLKTDGDPNTMTHLHPKRSM